jgi:hypothetical protein
MIFYSLTNDLGICMNFNYSLNHDDYSVRNALTWGNFSGKHFQKAGESRFGSRIIHILIGIVELIPVVGQISSIFEMIIVTQFGSPLHVSTNSSKFDCTQTPQVIASMGNATALEFISCVNPTLFTALTPLTEQEVQAFLNRGGALNIVSEDKMSKKPITIYSREQVITGCNSGINRSQVAAAIMTEMHVPIRGVLAGGDSAMNPEVQIHFFDPADEMSQSATNFRKTFLFPKFAQVGAKELPRFLEDREQMINAKKFYQDYIDSLSGAHFITFSSSGPSVLRRLLQRKGSLLGFTITYVPWGDEVAHPPEGITTCSRESYGRFASKLKACFAVSS